jgi:hypothetical protein
MQKKEKRLVSAPDRPFFFLMGIYIKSEKKSPYGQMSGHRKGIR